MPAPSCMNAFSKCLNFPHLHALISRLAGSSRHGGDGRVMRRSPLLGLVSEQVEDAIAFFCGGRLR
jgi:hypothetical protein